ncbi:peptidase T [Vibrio sp. WJH972]
MDNLLDRFLSYVIIDSQSNPNRNGCPSSSGQMKFAQMLEQELIDIGLSDVSLDENGYVMAKLHSNVDYAVPSIGLIAHMDTSPDAPAKNVIPQIVESYQGGDIALGRGDHVLSPIQYPELNQLYGHNLITTDGNTLLGADDKAGIAEILTAVEFLKQHPEIPHGEICIAFTPDEEIGRGADKFDVDKFGAAWAYTVDGGGIGELEYENFNASNATVRFYGNGVHPGKAKGKMVNSMRLAAKFEMAIPTDEVPNKTTDYEGFYHLSSGNLGIEYSELNYLLRDFELQGLEQRKAFIRSLAQEVGGLYRHGSVDVEFVDLYKNMKEMIEPHPHILDIAKQAMLDADVVPVMQPIRGGTDGAALSFKGLPCPNLFTGTYNFHSIHEFVSIEGMIKATEVIIKIAKNTATYQLK